jgi:hypothetical protein
MPVLVRRSVRSFPHVGAGMLVVVASVVLVLPVSLPADENGKPIAGAIHAFEQHHNEPDTESDQGRFDFSQDHHSF